MGYDDGVTAGLVYGGVMAPMLAFLGYGMWKFLTSRPLSEADRFHAKHGHRIRRTGNPIGAMEYPGEGMRIIYNVDGLYPTGKNITSQGLTFAVWSPRSVVVETEAEATERTSEPQVLSRRR